MTSSTHSVLVVDDEPEVLYSLRSLLRREFDLHTASSGWEALQILQRERIHVVMADQRMPGMTGVDFLTRVRKEHPDTVRLVFTGHADIKAVIEAINRGHVFRYVSKPWDPDELRLVLHQACAHYDQAAESKLLLSDLQSYLGRCLHMVQELRPVSAGSPTQGPIPEAEQLSQMGHNLLDRLNHALAPGPSPMSA